MSAVPIRVLFVDDHPLARHGMGYFLDAFPDLELVGSATSGEEALQLIALAQPDVVLMDLRMPGMGGVDATRQIKAHFPAVTVIALTSHDDSDLVQQALKAGAKSYLLKSVSPLELADAIRAARAGRAVLAPEIQQALIQSMTAEPSIGGDLSVRERDVLRLLVQGQSNDEIAERLGISRSTAKFHLRHIFDKLGVGNRAEAIVVAYQNDLV